MESPYEAIDALIDGEVVDAEAIDRALADPAGRAYLVDAWLLRDAVQEEMTADAPVPAAPPRATSSSTSWVIAAAVAAVCLLGGFLLGSRIPDLFRDAPTETAERPVAPAVVEPSPSRAPSSFPMPSPTRVIRLELDADWRDSSGGD
jgi:hypothetical protein